MHVRHPKERVGLAAILLVAAILPAVLIASPASAAPGDLDPAFGGDGRITTDLGADEVLQDMAIQADGKIVAVGSTGAGDRLDFLVVRYNPDGSLDATFGGDGTVTTSFASSIAVARAVVVQPDGKLVVAGSDGSVVLARYNPDGSLDNSFDGDGRATGPARAAALDVAIQADGKIIVAGTQPFGTTSGGFLARFNADGSLDPTFGFGGTVGDTTWENVALAVQPDGKVVVAGHARYGPGSCFVFSDYVLKRRNPDGSLDTTFDGDGTFRTNFGYTFQSDFCGGPGGDARATAVALQPDGRIVAAARVGPGYVLVRHNTNGSLDPTFGGDGTVGVDFPVNALAVQPDGRIVVAGGADGDFALARYNPDGSLDTTFDGDGMARTDFGGDDSAEAVAIQADGKVLAGGTTRGPGADFALARYLGADGGGAVCGSPATVVGTAGNDRLVGTSGDDVIAGLGGDDVIIGHGGNDVICGGEGNDVIDGGAGNDFLDGGVLGPDPAHAGIDHDRLLGGPAADILWSADVGRVDANGGDGNDVIEGLRGDDMLEGGQGNDTIRGREGRDFLDGGVLGPDPVRASLDDDDLFGGPGADTLWSADVGRVDANGGDGGDVIHGLIGQDVLIGGAGPDRVSGGRGADRIDVVDSVRGNDLADGAAGTDTCTADPGDVLVSCP